jgi:hypothetical protein
MPDEQPSPGPRRIGSLVLTWAPTVGSFVVLPLIGVLVEKFFGLLGLPGLVRIIVWALLIVCFVLLVVFALTRAPVRQAFGNLRRKWETPVEFTLLFTVLVVGVLLARALVPFGLEGWRRVAFDSCAARVELRVLTAPETRAALQRLGDQFADAQARREHCRPVRVSVSAASSISDLESAFQSDWAGLAFDKGTAEAGSIVLGPQPDIWIPPSSAAVDYLQGKGVKNLHPAGSIATSPLVVAVSDAQLRSRIGSPTGQTLADVVESVARPPRLPLARPNPETSEVGLVATMELYRRGPGQGDAGRRADENLMTQETLPGSDSMELLCALRRATRTTPDVAALVPEHVLFDYNSGAALGEGCPAQQPALKLYAAYPRGVGAFDYPFVRVSWPGQESWERDRMAGRFRDWLSAERLRGVALRDPRGDAGPATGPERTPLAGRPEFNADWRPPTEHPSGTALATALKQFRQARTAVSVLFVTDVSGSMGEAISTQGSRLDRARALLHTGLKFLGSEESGDYAELVTFPPTGQAGPSSPRPAKGSALKQLSERVDGLVAADGTSSPLYRTVGAAADQLSGVSGSGLTSAVVVLTDGGDSVRQGPGTNAPAKTPQARFSAQWRDSLIEKLRTPRDPGKDAPADAARPRVVFLTIGAPGWCDGEDATLLKRAAPGAGPSRVTCYDATTADREPLLTQVIGELRKG